MKRLRKYAVVTRISLQNAVAYRASVFARLVFYTLFIYIFAMLWRSIYKEGSVHGYSYTQMVWYLIFSEYVGSCCTTNVFSAMNDDVKSGAVSYQLVRPTHYVLYQYASYLGQVLVNLLSFGLLAGVLGLLFVGPLPGFSPASLPPLFLSVALSLTLNFFFMMLIALSAFVLEDNGAFFLIYQKINFMLGMFLPVEFLPSWLQPVAKNLPFSYIYWAPSRLFTDYSPAHFMTLVPRQAAWAALFVVLALVAYRGSVKRLQVNGG
jgi:ABC-2 type transport system permease protein